MALLQYFKQNNDGKDPEGEGECLGVVGGSVGLHTEPGQQYENQAMNSSLKEKHRLYWPLLFGSVCLMEGFYRIQSLKTSEPFRFILAFQGVI